VTVAAEVSLTMMRGECLALVGESGSGKTTTGRCILRLIEPTSGQIRFRNEDVLGFSRARMRQARRDMQIVFQDPFSSLNPRMRVGAIVEEPLIIHRVADRQARKARVTELFELVGLDPSQLSRYPHQFSGGQRQRIGLARALALNPSFIIADEPVSALDVSVQAQVVNLLMELQDRLKLTYLFIAHDLRLVRHICSRVAVMYLGKIVELGDTEAIFAAPAHPTRARYSRRFRCRTRTRPDSALCSTRHRFSARPLFAQSVKDTSRQSEEAAGVRPGRFIAERPALPLEPAGCPSRPDRRGLKPPDARTRRCLPRA